MKPTRPRKSTAKVKPAVGVAENEAPKESNEPGATMAKVKPGVGVAESEAPKESNKPGEAIAPPTERIRLRAYELFLARGATHGNDLADWFIAELELREKR